MASSSSLYFDLPVLTNAFSGIWPPSILKHMVPLASLAYGPPCPVVFGLLLAGLLVGVLANLRYRRLFRKQLACLQAPPPCTHGFGCVRAPPKTGSDTCAAGVHTLSHQPAADRASNLEAPDPQEVQNSPSQPKDGLLHGRAACLLTGIGPDVIADGGQRRQQLLAAARQRPGPYRSKVAMKHRVSI